MTTINNFDALTAFAKYDNEFMKNESLANLVDTRYDEKMFILNTKKEDIKTVAKDVMNGYDKVESDYVNKKVDGFLKKTTISKEPLTETEKQEDITKTKAFAQAVHTVFSNPDLKAMNDEQAKFRQGYKKLIDDVKNSILSQNPKISKEDLLDSVVNVFKPYINDLPVGDKTKAYAMYKIGYMVYEGVPPLKK